MARRQAPDKSRAQYQNQRGFFKASRGIGNSKLLTFVDQALSSATNFGGSALAAGLLSEPDFGAFAVAISVLTIILGLSRTWSGLILMMVAPGKDDEAFRPLFAGAVGAAAAVGTLGAVVCVIGGLVVGGRTGDALMMLALCIPIITIQDAIRFGALSRGKPAAACLNDAAWLGALIVTLMVLRRTDTASLRLAVLAANGSAFLGIVVALRRFTTLFNWPAFRKWIASFAHLSIRLMAEFPFALASTVIPLILLTAWNANLDQAGALRGAQVMMGPLAVLFAASTAYAQPVMTERHRRGGNVMPIARSQSAVNTAASFAWIAIVAVIPARVGVRVFGATWFGIDEIAVIVGISFVGLGISSGALTALRSRGQLNAGLFTQASIAIVVVASTSVGGFLASKGTLLGFAGGNLIGSFVAWAVVFRWKVSDMVYAAEVADG